jgi:hypothetical protein
MAQRVAPNAKNAWPVFKGYYQQIAYFHGHFHGVPLQGDKLAAEPLIRQISEDWARIQTDHPVDHVRLKIELRKAIRLYKVEATASARAMRRLQSLCEQNRAAVNVSTILRKCTRGQCWLGSEHHGASHSYRVRECCSPQGLAAVSDQADVPGKSSASFRTCSFQWTILTCRSLSSKTDLCKMRQD